jgi:PUA domain protein
MRRTSLRSKELNKELENLGYQIEVSKKDLVELLDGEDYKIILVNKQPWFFYYGEKLVPTLKLLQTHPELLKHIMVDMGAVKFMVSGADVMRPGIKEIPETLEKEDFVVIVDQNNKKPLAVGVAQLNFEEMQKATSGKVIKNIHYVGDEIWKFEVR